MFSKNHILYFAALSLVLFVGTTPKAKEPPVIPARSRVYIAPMDGFETYLKAAIEEKQVPLIVVENKQDAEYEITGIASSQKASTAKKIFGGSWHSREEASMQVTDLKTSMLVFAYSYVNENSMHGKKSSAESCAKHLKEAVKVP